MRGILPKDIGQRASAERSMQRVGAELFKQQNPTPEEVEAFERKVQMNEELEDIRRSIYQSPGPADPQLPRKESVRLREMTPEDKILEKAQKLVDRKMALIAQMGKKAQYLPKGKSKKTTK